MLIAGRLSELFVLAVLLLLAPRNGLGQDSAKSDDASLFRVGVSRANITPRESMWMAGYASRKAPFSEILQDLWAKAVVITDHNDHHIVLVTLDLVGIERALGDTICERLQKNHGLQRSQICLATSHTHSGPVVGMNLRAMHYFQLEQSEQKKILDYSNELVEKIATAVASAFENRQVAMLEYGEGATQFAANRRNNKEGDVPKLRAEGKLVGPIDHSVPVLVAYDAQHQPLAIVFGYGCHSTVLSGDKICGDYPGFAQVELEKRFPGATALFWAGCGADINPIPRRDERLAELYGRMLATEVESVMLTQKMKSASGPIVSHFELLPLKLATLPTPEELKTQTQSANIYEAMRAKLLLEQIAQGQPLSPTYPYPITSWVFADGPKWIHLGGETVVDYSLRIKSEHPQDTIWVTSYANDVMAYIPSERVLKEGGYEGATSMVYYGLPTLWAPGLEQQIISKINEFIGP